jgi:hypothetical protein
MISETDQNTGLLRRFDLLIMLSAVVTLFVALGTEAWWTLNGATTSSLFSIQVSPFYLRINAIGLPSTVPLAVSLGSLTRTLLLLGFVALFAASLRPTAWWRNLALYFGFASLAELYLSFILMYYWAETTFVNAYGVVPPFYGTTSLQANILGLNLSYYPTPLVTAAFGVPYYLGFISIGLVMGRTILKALHDRAFQVLASLLPGGGVRDIYLSPPYRRVWFSSEDRGFNPLAGDPERTNDDELLVSFQKLYDAVEPGGSLSVTLPALATTLEERLERLMPQTGFVAVTSAKPNSAQNSQMELRFRKPVVEKQPSVETETALEPVPEPVVPTLSATEQPATQELPVETVSLPVLEVAEAPAWVPTRMTRLERSILKAAIMTITEKREPVPYRELLNQVYMDLVDRKVEFDSARQIETTLLDHNGKELLLVEEADETRSRVVKKWWLGDQKIGPDRNRGLQALDRVKEARPNMASLRGIFRTSRRPRYKPITEGDDEDSSAEPSEN